MSIKPIKGKRGNKRHGTISEASGMYGSGQGQTKLKQENQFYNGTNTFKPAIKDAWLHASTSLGLTASISESVSTGYTQDNSIHGGMLGERYLAPSLFDECKQKGSYCFISNDSGSGFFNSGSFIHFVTGSGKTDPKSDEIYTNFIDYVDNKIMHKLSTQMVAHIGITAVQNYLTGSVTSSGNDLKTLTEAL